MQLGKLLNPVPIDIDAPRLKTGFLEANIAQTRNRYAHKRSDVEYALDWYERVKWATSGE